MSEFGLYSGKEFFDLKFPKREFLVESIIKEKDSVILVGEEKAGKSILIFQLITALTSKHPFLDKFSVSKPCKVTYVQLEGELHDSQDRFNRMIGSIDFDRELFNIKFSEPLKLQEEADMQKLIREIELKQGKPDVIIIDPIYFALTGSLSDDDIVRKFIGNIRIMKDHFGCSIILVHHCHKIKLDPKGNVLFEGDNAMFGSIFFKAWADHTFLFRYDKVNNIRILSCDTQRAGDIIKNLKLKLIEPNPLYFDIITTDPTNWAKIHDIIFNKPIPDGYTCELVEKALGMKRDTFYRSIKEPLRDGILFKNKIGKVVHYTLDRREDKP